MKVASLRKTRFLTLVCFEAAIALIICGNATADSAPTAESPGSSSFDANRVSELGLQIYTEDRRVVRALAILKERQKDLGAGSIRGWTYAWSDSGDRVRFVQETKNGLEAAYDVVFARDAEPTLSIPANRGLQQAGLDQLRAQHLALANAFNSCGGGLRPVILQDPRSDQWIVWLVPQPQDSAAFPIGGYQRFYISHDGTVLVSRELLAAGCLATNPPPSSQRGGSKPVALALSNTISPVPLEIHVYMSLLSGHMVYLTTSEGLWSIDGTHIARIK